MNTRASLVSEYLYQIGCRGGSKSRRRLSPEDARNMVRVRKARRALRKDYAQCFWYLREDTNVTLADVPEIIRGLRQNGERQGYLRAERLCR